MDISVSLRCTLIFYDIIVFYPMTLHPSYKMKGLLKKTYVLELNFENGLWQGFVTVLITPSVVEAPAGR